MPSLVHISTCTNHTRKIKFFIDKGDRQYSLLSDLKDLIHEFEEKIIEAKDFMRTGNKDMKQLRERYQTLSSVRPFSLKQAIT